KLGCPAPRATSQPVWAVQPEQTEQLDINGPHGASSRVDARPLRRCSRAMSPDSNKGRDHRPPARPPMVGANLGAVGPLASYEEVDHLWRLMRELSSLLEGSMVTLGRAKESLSGDHVFEAATAGEVETQLKDAAAALERMSELVHAAMQGPSVSIGSSALSRARPVRLGEAIAHAVELLGAMARERSVELGVELAPGIADMPAAALYTVVLNGLQNAVEAVSKRGGRGRVDLSLRHDGPPP